MYFNVGINEYASIASTLGLDREQAVSNDVSTAVLESYLESYVESIEDLAERDLPEEVGQAYRLETLRNELREEIGSAKAKNTKVRFSN